MKFYTETGTPAAPDGHRPIRPEHYDPHARRFGPSNHIAIAHNGREYILKAARSFDLWDDNVLSKWIAQLTADQTRELKRVLAKTGNSIDKLLKIDWTKNPEGMTAQFAAQVNKLTEGAVNRQTLADAFFRTFKPLLTNAPEIYGHKHRYLSITRFDEHDARALDFLTKVGTDNAGNAIGKYVDERGSQTIINIVKRGMKAGLGPDEVAGDVAKYVKGKIPMNKTSYARLVADQLMVRTRSHSAVSSMRQAGFRSMIWTSVLDEVTTNCPREDMPIATVDGPMPAINVPVGMRVLTRTQQWKRIAKKFVRIAKMWRCFRFRDTSTLVITPSHRILSSQDWIKAQDLINDEWVDTLKHNVKMDRVVKGELQIKEARTRRFEGRAVNFEVEGDDPSYVAAGVVVHNCCRFMHGKTINIADATAALDRAYAGGYTPEDLEKNSPWMKQKGDNLILGNTTVATIKESAVGQWDAVGSFDDKGKDLTRMGLAAPPGHPNCRSNLTPTFSNRQLAPGYVPGEAPKKPPTVPTKPGIEIPPMKPTKPKPIRPITVGPEEPVTIVPAKPKPGYQIPTAPTEPARPGERPAWLQNSPLIKDNKIAKILEDQSKLWDEHMTGVTDKLNTEHTKDFINKNAYKGKKHIKHKIKFLEGDKKLRGNEDKDVLGIMDKYFKGKSRPPISFGKRTIGDEFMDFDPNTSVYGKPKPGESTIRLGMGWEDDSITHEYMHHIAMDKGPIEKLMKNYFKAKTAGESSIQMPDGYWTKVDKFFNEYMGYIGMNKNGKSGGVEILSVVAEKIAKDPSTMLEFNPDLFHFALAVMRGVI